MKKAGLGILIAILLLFVAELLLKVLNIPHRGIYEGDPATLWWLRSNLNIEMKGPKGTFNISTNDKGLRGDGKKGDWLALGCSTTFGWGVEKTPSRPG